MSQQFWTHEYVTFLCHFSHALRELAPPRYVMINISRLNISSFRHRQLPSDLMEMLTSFLQQLMKLHLISTILSGQTDMISSLAKCQYNLAHLKTKLDLVSNGQQYNIFPLTLICYSCDGVSVQHPIQK